LFHELDPELGSWFNLCVELEPKPRFMFLKSLKLVVYNWVTISSSLSQKELHWNPVGFQNQTWNVIPNSIYV
jgi:hypothetical protein